MNDDPVNYAEQILLGLIDPKADEIPVASGGVDFDRVEIVFEPN